VPFVAEMIRTGNRDGLLDYYEWAAANLGDPGLPPEGMADALCEYVRRGAVDGL
jgi:hypothetical protein